MDRNLERAWGDIKRDGSLNDYCLAGSVWLLNNSVVTLGPRGL